MTIEEVCEAIRRADGDQWPIADAIAAMPEMDDEGKKWTQERIANEVWQRLGVEWKRSTLSKYALTARAFPENVRHRTLSFNAYVELRRSPETLAEWVAGHQGKTLTVEAAKGLAGRGAISRKAPVAGRLKSLHARIESIADDDPDLVLEALEAWASELRNRYARRLKSVS